MGQITIPSLIPKKKPKSCSATAINPRVVVTARHCFSSNPTVAPDLVRFTLPGMFYAIAGERIVAHTGALDVSKGDQDRVLATGDLAVVVLANSIPPDLVSTFMKVDFSPDVFPLYLGDPELKVFQTGFGGTKWDSDSGVGYRRTGSIGHFYFTDSLPVWYSNPFNGPFYVATANEDGSGDNSTHAKGDSGGPLWISRIKNNEFTERRLVGVTSGHYSYPVFYFTPIGSVFWYTAYKQTWAPTWNVTFSDSDGNHSSSNGSLILDALGDDADNDGIQDDVDNCPPSFCKYDPMACANTLQEDSDHDGYGDACDTCPEIDFYVPGKPPPDRDNDGVQDSCDTCPAYSNKWSQADTDTDGVGDACDNCKGEPNKTKSCTSDAQCPKTPSGGDNFCVLPVGRCAAQVDDRDNDGLGDSCDGCPDNDQNGLRQLYDNSNLAAELRWNAPELLDVCDPIPVYVSRPVPQHGVLCPTDTDPTAKCLDSLPLEGMAILGAETHTKTTPTATSFKAPVGFRHCDCHVNGVELPYETCINGRCRLEKSDYFNTNSNYQRVTMAGEATPEATIYPSTNAKPYFASRTFTNSFTSNETTLWRWKLDVDAGHVPAYLKPVPLLGTVDTTTGIFWSHALSTNDPASSRDATFEQQLRSHHEYVETPYVARIDPLENLPQWPAPKGACPIMPCGLLLRPDTARVNPNPFDHNIFERFQGSALILVDQGAPVLVDREAKAYDATPLLSESLTTRLLDGSTQWLRPVEAGHTMRAMGRTTQFVALPNDWTRGSPITTLAYEQDQLVEQSRTHGLALLGEPDEGLQPAEPMDRNGARGIFTARANAVYLVGGAVDVGKEAHSTGEIWRYDLEGHVWEHVITGTPLVKDVLAVAYDSAREELLVLDTTERTSWFPPPIRLLLVNTRTRTSTLLGTFPRTPLFDRYSLTARGDGSYLLVASRKQTARVVMARLSITSAEKLAWTGLTTRNGKLFDEPALTDDGVVLPLLRGGKLELPTITDADFGPCPGVPDVF